ncbi:MAG: DUF58 domain-containing protein [Campylobacterota bacterium]|nr:DUF58 domain-containing protein [Campylobacterota bacterium]
MKSAIAFISILRSVKNRPTKYFFFLIVAIVTLFLQAYMHNYNIVYLVMFFLFSVAGASSHFGVLNLGYLHVRLLSCSRFFASQSSTCSVMVENRYKNSSYDLTLINENEKQHIDKIEADSHCIVELKYNFAKRGVVKLPKIRVESLFPLPHELKYRLYELDDELVVYAKPQGVSIFKKYIQDSSLHGEIDDFDSIKRHNSSDDISLIHWPSLAKSETLMSKSFTYTNESKKLHFDFKSAAQSDEKRLSQLTLWVLECEKNGFDFTLEISNRTLDSKKLSHDEILKIIATY